MIYRIDVRTNPPARGGEAAADPLGQAVRQQIKEFGATVGPIATSRIFLIDSDADRGQIQRAARELLADPVVESAELVSGNANGNGHSRIEIHLKPGVMDPVAASTEMALRDMGLNVREVRTGRAYVIDGKIARDELARIANRVLANGVIESVHFDAYVPQKFESGHPYEFRLRHVALRQLTDEQLQKLSREGHLFLSLAEMKAIQNYFREQNREPTDIELETLAQTWSEHCVHKTLKSGVEVEVQDESGEAIGKRSYKNLIKETIFASTMELMRGGRHEGTEARRHEGNADRSPDFCLSVFSDNAGVIAFDETDAVCFKVETHNHPSAIEPYGGSATGIGGVIRDILGTGLGAKPVANTDVFCVAYPDYEKGSGFEVQGPGKAAQTLADSTSANQHSAISIQHSSLPRGVIHPKRILQQIVAGVRDYGNRMGIPTVNGAVYFDDRYLGNPLVFCGCVGLIPRDKIDKAAQPGDAIVVMGGRTGRDGIHGATFSSAELTDTHADEFSHAVQIGNAITEKKVADVLLAARDRGLFTAVTDCGAGGLSSAVGEMGEKIGAAVELDRVPLKYAGLRYDEIWISEAQERMVLSVPKEKLRELLDLSESEDVEASVIGEFGTTDDQLILRYRGDEVGRMSMDFVHHGIPMPTRRAIVTETKSGTGVSPVAPQASHGRDARATLSIRDRLLAQLAHPNTASKHWIIRQYDHEVQGGSVIKPLTGPLQIGPSDASVVRPKLNSQRGVVVGCGLSPQIEDPYEMALAAIDEAVRNVVAVGADPSKVAILDNFCWPSVDDERTMGTLVRACEACRDAALAYGIPFISGKDSLHNQFTDSETGRVIRIPNTLLISAIGIIEDVRKCVTMDLKDPRDGRLSLIMPGGPTLADRIATHRALADAIRREMIGSCHDVSEGGYLTAVAEMCIASGLGADIEPADAEQLFAETVGCYVVETYFAAQDDLRALLKSRGAKLIEIGKTSSTPQLQIASLSPDRVQKVHAHLFVEEMTKAWRGTLDW
ncbi:MAG TPA: phosphoribosylformylglycinamidine synthase subunit PurS [Humisphaera sp.]|nr:phosphoribosylformylglycinamidine synthase subunit PurS [Humisphaera sp.]